LIKSVNKEGETGLCLLLIMVEIDLSIGSSMAMAGIIVALSMKNWGLSIPVSIVLALVTTTFIGLVNGFLVVKLGINFLIATLAMMGIVRGLVVVLAEGGGLPSFHQVLMPLVNPSY